MSAYSTVFRRLLFPLYEERLRSRSTLRYLAEMEEAQWLSPQEIRERQWGRLQEMLRHCERSVPYYRRAFAEAGIRARDIQAPDDLRRIPLLSREDVKGNLPALNTEAGRASGRLFSLTTSGSSGVPVRVVLDHDAYERRRAAWIRGDRWAGWDLGVKMFQLVGGVPMSRTAAWRRLKQRLNETITRQKIVSVLRMSRQDLMRYFKCMNAFRAPVLYGYGNSVYHFARFIRDNALKPHQPRSVIVSAEKIFQHHKDFIEQAFRAPVFERYGSMEFSFIAAECDRHLGMHVNSDNLYVEILDEQGRPVAPGEVGEIVISGMNNYAMPLIRYRIGDFGTWAPGPCTCGRGLPLLAEVLGRVTDVISTRSGRACTGILFPYILDEFPSVAQFQVTQESPDRIIVRLVPHGAIEPQTLVAIEGKLRKYLGRSIELRLEISDSIPRTSSGKLHHTNSSVSTSP